jgi:hypothetical protein
VFVGVLVCEAAARFLRRVLNDFICKGWNLSNLYPTTNFSPFGCNLKRKKS